MSVFLGELDAGQLVPILRYLFLSAITNQAPEVLEELGNEILPLFVKVSSTTSEQHQHSANESALKWRDKIINADFSYTEIRNLRAQHTEKAFAADTALQTLLEGFFNWADRWNLNADWFLLRALKTLKYWEKHEPLRANLQWSMSLPLTAGIEDEPNPPEGFPIWDEWRESRKQYVGRVTKMAKDSIAKDPILSKGKRLRKTGFIDSISEVANQYCESIIKLYEQKNYRRIRERPSAALHIEWLVDFQINKTLLKEIAEGSSVDIRAVTKAVKNTLKILELKKRTAIKGRPRGSTDTKKRSLIVRHIK